MQQLRGTGVALVTPFNKDLSVDYDGLTAVVEHCISGGVDYIVMLGTTAENVTLTSEEKQKVVSHIKNVVNKRKPLVLGVGGNNTQLIVDELKNLDTTDITAILSVSPAYNKPTQNGIYAHFASIAQASPLPVILYNVPSRTGSNMSPDTVLRLARDFDNVVGIKEAAGDMVQVLKLLRDRPDGFLVISGDDMLALPLVLAGGDGVISVIGQGVVEPFCGMIKDGLDGAFAKAYEAHFKLMPIIDFIFEEGNPAGIKSVLAVKNKCSDEVRLPLVKASAALEKKIRTYLEAL
ncbi:4-hydroxy-tetrahydrodipicolinate synthase [Dokdonia sinensis]|uniref:4-hydroxy-tetrahydrodipicolinate synthase n=1 Tax=Dokdonia sinensis TaxID=2479847 RepID=A0A3M0G4Q2_9FLAO|nr:4-hydroxy-tetrahydrodipicolinate synthase [Dokdonia sinensis]RMB56139.1 4-hydroxy-tetrahydrodipicolinate synthase [Dokdonia sinensis]